MHYYGLSDSSSSIVHFHLTMNMNLLSTPCTHPLCIISLESELVEEMPEDPNIAGDYYYEEPDLSGGVEGVDYYIAYGDDTGAEDPEQQE